MSPFFQQFTPLMSQSASTSVQAAANAAATLLLTSNLSQQQTIPMSEKSPSPPPPSAQENSSAGESSENLGKNVINQETVRFFLHKLIEHNFLQQIQQQQHLNDLINNNNNHPNTNNNHSNGGMSSNNFTKDKSPSSDADGDFFNHHMLSPQSNHTKTFLDFLKNAAAAQSGINHTMSNQRNHQGFKRCEEK
jgi:hypothetical protein